MTILFIFVAFAISKGMASFENFRASYHRADPIKLYSTSAGVEEMVNPYDEKQYKAELLRTDRKTPSRYYKENEDDGYRDNSTRGYKTYGRGQAQIPRGGSAEVPNTINRNSFNYRHPYESQRHGHPDNEPRGLCVSDCPESRAVVATKGNDFVIFPPPCPNGWNQLSGPQPGSKISEGLYTISGTLRPNNKFCQFEYQVLVRRCEPLKPYEDNTTVQCSNNYIWGSKCSISCGENKEATGPVELECLDNFTWSNPMPKCNSAKSCSLPKGRNKSKMWCQKGNVTRVYEDNIPNGSICRFKKNGKNMAILCKAGIWRGLRKRKEISKPKNEIIYTKIRNPSICESNPCRNGGTCLEPDTNDVTFMCLCDPGYAGVYCEKPKCDYRYCRNKGFCLFENGKNTCYCFPGYYGDICQIKA